MLFHLVTDTYQMKKILWAPREKLDHIRWNLLKSQIHNVYQNIPFYRKFLKKNNLSPQDFKGTDDLKKFPIIQKEDIRKDFRNFLNEKLDINKCFRSHTSGSTGEPFWSYFDQKCWIRKKYLSKLRARLVCGMRPWEKVAIFVTEPPEEVLLLNKKNLLTNPFLKAVYFSVFDDPETILQRICEIKPQNTYGPLGFFFHFAQLAKKQDIKTPYLKRMFTSSEYHGKAVHKFIRDVFDAEIYDIYGSTEFKEVAWECDRHQGYHINEDEVFCEILNGDNPALHGEVGDIVLTDLQNSAMPLIRYRSKDKGRMIKGKCLCGRTFSLMQPVAGRSSEYIQLPNGEYLSPYLFTTAVEKCTGLLQYQFIQKTPTDLFVNAVLDFGAGKELVFDIEKIVRKVTKGLMNVNVQQMPKIPMEKNGKFKVVKSLSEHDLKTEKIME